MKTLATIALLVELLAPAPVWATEAMSETKEVILYKNPQCTCCEGYAAYLRKNGFSVKVIATQDLTLIKKEHGVPEQLEGCHTSIIDGYVVEGHVTVDLINRLLAEKPHITGISLPGMPMGTPGMD